MKDYYIFKSGRISRKDNSIFLETGDENIPIPVNDIESIYLFGEIDLNTKAINFLASKNIIIHFFNYYGWYTSSLYPRETLLSGYVIVNQAEHYLNNEKRIFLAKQFVKAAFHGMIYNLKRYKVEQDIINKIEDYSNQIDKQKEISALMGVEGNGHELYYSAFKYIFSKDVEFTKRVRRPPDNMINALISFLNSLVYTAVIKEILQTQLNPTISFLHEPFYRRFSLALDVAEIFKPIFADRILFDLINNDIIDENHFDKDLNYCYLKENGMKLVVKKFDEKMGSTIHHRKLRRNVSYRQLIRLELYKLIKHFINEETYKSFLIWW